MAQQCHDRDLVAHMEYELRVVAWPLGALPYQVGPCIGHTVRAQDWPQAGSGLHNIKKADGRFAKVLHGHFLGSSESPEA